MFMGRVVLFLLVSCSWIPMEVLGRTGTTIANSTVSSRPSVLRIGVLFTLNSVIGRSAKPAVMAAVDDVNANTSILPGTKLEIILHDTNCSGFLGTLEGICKNLNFSSYKLHFLLFNLVSCFGLKKSKLPSK